MNVPHMPLFRGRETSRAVTEVARAPGAGLGDHILLFTSADCDEFHIIRPDMRFMPVRACRAREQVEATTTEP